MGLFGKKKEEEERENIWTRNARATWENDGVGTFQTIKNTPPIATRCSHRGCNKRLIGSYGFDSNGNPVCFKHM